MFQYGRYRFLDNIQVSGTTLLLKCEYCRLFHDVNECNFHPSVNYPTLSDVFCNGCFIDKYNDGSIKDTKESAKIVEAILTQELQKNWEASC